MEVPLPPRLLDGATGTNLMRVGMPISACPEQWILEHPGVLLELQRAYIEAGAQVLYAPTFTANRAMLSRFGKDDEVDALNAKLVALTKAAAEASGVLVAGDIAPTNLAIEPFGETPFLELVNIYSEQAFALKNAGVDLIVCETMISMTGMRAAVLGARQTGLPLYVTMSMNEEGETLDGSNMLSCMIAAQSLGVKAFGINCTGRFDKLTEQIERLIPYAQVPLIAKPSLGEPDAHGEYPMTPEEFAAAMKQVLDAGASMVGGCCGATPAHIAALRLMVESYDFAGRKLPQPNPEDIIACSYDETFFLTEDLEFSEPLSCEVDMTEDILEAEDEGWDAVLVEVPTPDDAYHFAQNAHMTDLPVAFLSDNESALEMALIYYPGRAIVCSSMTDLEREVLEKICEGYGALLF
ncbi:homocysteine S-methyltransferase family protein [Zongyangia hominis]|uniref:Homocysteine S-methyltransferase family protein n=1 Tax=Zongyangia hominis TaxID=2763677 RepID=A0A926IB82_9FIRM|nr:homocysteine S-methyltransferase family protein [Zongyangia hominis]MBC8570976.1 homocysteine S-methyltransferase family protein [Zongyangia hominis]